MDARIGDLAHPPVKMRLERGPAVEAAPGDRVVLDVADAALVLALGARPVRRAGPRPKTPVARNACSRALNRTSRVAASWSSTSARALSNRTSCGTPPKWPNAASMPSNQADCRSYRKPREHPPRIAGRRDEQAQLHGLAANKDPGLAEVDLQLALRRRLEPQRRPRFGGPSDRRRPFTARSTVRRLTRTPCSRSRSWRTTSALPRCWRNRSASRS